MDFDVADSRTDLLRNKPGLFVYPNPVKNNAKISYVVEKTSETSMELFDITGKKIQSLLNKMMQPGRYSLQLDVGDLPAGMYFIRYRTGDKVSVHKMLRDG
jgi:hypothetical protein